MVSLVKGVLFSTTTLTTIRVELINTSGILKCLENGGLESRERNLGRWNRLFARQLRSQTVVRIHML